MDKIIKATATYTGGGIYIYTGQLENGDYFMTNDDLISYMAYVEFFNADPYEEFEDACNEIWQSEHHIGEYSDRKAYEFTKEILNWIIQQRPEGNYSVNEIESRLSKL